MPETATVRLRDYQIDLLEETSAEFASDKLDDFGNRWLWRFHFAFQKAPFSWTFDDADYRDAMNLP
ncbi:MAG: hypothetical protein NTY19_48595 [Planctomycetota bacterium]|nr:hypothetical protein [Planctomycetota bacterium]